MSSLPGSVQRLAYRASGARAQLSLERYQCTLRDNRFVLHDVRRRLPFRDSSVDYLYSSHLLEHLEREEAVLLMAESRRILKPGGAFRIVVPDLAYFIGLYERGSRDQAVAGIFASGVPGPLGRHRYMYDEAGLSALARDVGYGEAQRCAFGVGMCPISTSSTIGKKRACTSSFTTRGRS